MSSSTITSDGDVRLPAEVAEATGLEPGVEVDIEVTDSGVLVRRRELAEQEDADDVEAAKAALRELEQGGQSLSWTEIKRESGL
jgi:bifunctional DNA-binding transcriptional regulator/antitoxin component of YhaV-PrlF toxin-antitoxin module